MTIKTGLASLAAIASIALLSACTPVASDSPALEKGQPASQEKAVTQEEPEAPAVPQECLDAFDDAEDIDSILTEAVMVSADAVGYAIDLDSAGLDQVNADLEALAPRLEDARTDYSVAATVCESADPPSVCTDALGSAEDIDDILSQAIDSSSRSIEYAIDLNADGLDEETALIEELTPKVEEARINFAVQSTDCRANEGV